MKPLVDQDLPELIESLEQSVRWDHYDPYCQAPDAFPRPEAVKAEIMARIEILHNQIQSLSDHQA